MRRLVSLAVLLAASPAMANEPPPGPNWTILWEPGLLIAGAFGVAIEHAVAASPSIGVAVVVGGGASDRMAIGENLHSRYHFDSGNTAETIRFQRWHGGVQSNYYFRRPLSGPHVGLELTMKQFFPTFDEDVTVFTTSPYVGWKWVLASGFTVSLTAGASLVVTDDSFGRSLGWHVDDDGSLGPLHLYVGLGVGWSFNDGSP